MAYNIVFVEERPPTVLGDLSKEKAVGENIFLANLLVSPKVFAFFYPGETATDEVERRLRALGKRTGINLFVNFSTLVDPDYKRAVERFRIKALPVIIVTAVSPLAATPSGESTFVRLDGKSLFAKPEALVRTVEELFNLFLSGKIARAVMVGQAEQGKAAAAAAAAAVWAVISKVIDWAADRDFKVEFTPVKIEVKKSGGEMMDGARRAVVIGINDYQNDKIENLSGAVYDATEIREILTLQGGFTVDDKHFLTDKRATSENIRTAISDLFWSTEGCGIALFYFSGHGKRDHLGHGYLLPHDVHHDAPFVRGIRIQELKQLFLHAPCKDTCIMILDCCYSGIATQVEKGESENAEHLKSFREELDLKSRDSGRFIEELELTSKGSGRFIWASADADKTAREEEREHALGGGKHIHGLFSFHLIEGLRGGEMDFGRISVGALEKYIEAAFKDAEHKPQLSANAVVDKHEIYLTEMKEELEKRIRETLDEVVDYLEVDHKHGPSPASVMSAIRILNALKKRNLRPPESDQHWSRIAELIKASADPAYKWWMDNKLRFPSGASKTRSYKLLNEMLLDLELPKICQLGEREMSFVASVLEVIQSEGVDPQFRGHEKVVRYINGMEGSEESNSRRMPLRVSTLIKGPPTRPTEG